MGRGKFEGTRGRIKNRHKGLANAAPTRHSTRLTFLCGSGPVPKVKLNKRDTRKLEGRDNSVTVSGEEKVGSCSKFRSVSSVQHSL